MSLKIIGYTTLSLLYILITSAYSGVPYIPQQQANYEVDKVFCNTKHPELNLLPKSILANSTLNSTGNITSSTNITSPATSSILEEVKNNSFYLTAAPEKESKNLKFIID